ncbi:MAG: HflC protein [Planctomycetes bacterium RBG_16_41_13]|nr:MAG: HflC protein [Planctomycetes bacterium RBG_16_41_13]
MKRTVIIVLIAIGIMAIFLKSSLYVVDERLQAVITQFGKPVRTTVVHGLHVKTPFIQDVRYFNKRILNWSGEISDILTRDKENIGVASWARWKIVDPLSFYTSLGIEARGQGLLDEVIESAVKNVVSAYPLKEVLRNSNRKLEYTTKELEVAEETKKVIIKKGRDEITAEILAMARRSLEDRYGIELVDVRIKYINYVAAVIPKIYDRMRSERIRIANKYESEGRREEAEILGTMRKELERIESEGYRTAEETRGQADAEAIKIYAEAYTKAPELYSFLKTLETYKTTISAQTRLILNTDGEYFRYLKGFEKDGGAVEAWTLE